MKTNLRKLGALMAIMLIPLCSYGQRVAEHALLVKRIRNWAPKYLTVINNYGNLNFENAPSTLRFLSVITAVNGNSTEDMDENDFYRLIDQPGNVELSYMTKINGQNKSFTEKLVRRNGLAPVLVTKGYREYIHYNFYYEKLRSGNYYTPSMITDEDVDFFGFCTFDFAYGDGNEELEKKAMLNKFARRLEEKGLKRDKENPDLYIYVTCDLKRNIESVYQPTVTSTTNSHYAGNYASGGTTWVGSSFISYHGRGSGVVNGRSSTVTTETGRLQTLETNDLYMQLSVLDAHRVGEKAVPKVWQFTANKRYGYSINEKEYENIAEVLGLNYPFGTNKYGQGIVYGDGRITCYDLFVDRSNPSKPRISEVLPNGWADNYGIKVNSNIYGRDYSRGRKSSMLGFWAHRLYFKIDEVSWKYIIIDGKKKSYFSSELPAPKQTGYYYIKPDDL